LAFVWWGELRRPERWASTATGLFSTQGKKATNTKSAVQNLPHGRNKQEHETTMSKSDEAEQRAKRLAAKLRENLKRRKTQSKARSDADAAAPEPAAEKLENRE
jgi:hypothetical protein